MPIYEYRCEACGHEFEVMQKITESPIKKCEACKKPRVKRLISHTSFQLKGGGWYSDLYGSSSSKSKSSTPSSSPATSAKASSTSSSSSSSASSSASSSSSSSASSSSSSSTSSSK